MWWSVRKRNLVSLFLFLLFVLAFSLGYEFVITAFGSPTFGTKEWAEVGVGMTFCGLSIALLATSLLVFLSSNNQQACRYLRWLGKWKSGS